MALGARPRLEGGVRLAFAGRSTAGAREEDVRDWQIAETHRTSWFLLSSSRCKQEAISRSSAGISTGLVA